MLAQIIIATFNIYFYSILKVVEKNSSNPKENKDDTDYGIQYLTNFKQLVTG